MLHKQECENDLKVLSIEELKQFEGLSDLTDQQAMEVIKTLKELSLIVHKIISRHEQFRSISKLCKEKCQENSK